jgi:parallel beta-helix repeat protein
MNTKRGIFLAILSILVFCAFIGNSSAATIYVPDDYAKIQWAIDNATAESTIIVNSDTYYENVNVYKQLILRGVDTGTGKPVVDAGGGWSAITLNADGITLDGFTATHSGGSERDAGIMAFSSNNIIANNDVSNNYENGIYHYSSSNNTITGNNASNNLRNGIYLYSSSNNTITGNNVSNNWDGICISYSSNNNTITSNNASDNWNGIRLSSSSNNTITGNTFVNDGLFVCSSYQNAVEDNTVNGKPLIYLEDIADIVVTDAGQVILVTCNNITVEDLDLSNIDTGIELWQSENSIISNNAVSNNRKGICIFHSSNNTITGNNVSDNDNGIGISSSSNNTITGNNVSDNGNGIGISSSSNNTITGNNVSSNNGFGIRHYSSSFNEIYLNNFINNRYNVYSYDSTNIWNSTEKISYVYNGTTYGNYTGNYWDDYEGSDANNDGIGDTPYNISSDKDNYPLMEPFENYLVPTSTTFDTDEGTYPSIFGTHNGTIKPLHDVIVNKMYTYPCVGTGGHSEWVAFYNSTTGEEIANGTWKGYAVSDYHYIEFDKEFVLRERVTYNYTIRTGSYPQIIHEHVLNTSLDGEITCTEFIDANGKRYENWIPAIRLE